MKGQYKYLRNSKPIVEAAIVGLMLATMFYNLDAAAQRCSLLDKASWVALEMFRPVILAAWQSVPACLCEDSRFLQHVLQIVASIWPLLCVMAG